MSLLLLWFSHSLSVLLPDTSVLSALSTHDSKNLLSVLSPVSPDSSLTGGSGCDDNTVPQKLLILDARSYTAAVANRAKGGGCECEGECHQTFENNFMNFVRHARKQLTIVSTFITFCAYNTNSYHECIWFWSCSVILAGKISVMSDFDLHSFDYERDNNGSFTLLEVWHPQQLCSSHEFCWAF